MSNKKLIRAALVTIEELAAQLAKIKNMFPVDHPVQNQAAFDVEAVSAKLEAALKIPN